MGFQVYDRNNTPSRLFLERRDASMSALKVAAILGITNLPTLFDIQMEADVLSLSRRLS